MSINHAIGFHAIIFDPSSGYIGIRLNSASQKFIVLAAIRMYWTNPLESIPRTISVSPITIFIAGPAAEIIPFCLLVTLRSEVSKKYVAPGAAKVNCPNDIIASIIASPSPGYHALYSDGNPKCFAVSLCASSCKTNPVPTPISAIGRATSKLSVLKNLGLITTANAKLSVIHDMIKSFFSFGLK